MTPKTITRYPAGVVNLPPSKSLSHRALICAGLAEGQSIIENIGDSRDIEATAACMTALGASITRDPNGRLIIEGTGFPKSGNHRLDCGESGSTLRFMLPLAAMQMSDVHFYGQGRLMERPMEPYEQALALHGVTLTRKNKEIFLRGPLNPGRYLLPGDVSSQFVSGLLLALPMLNGDSEIIMTTPLESASYVDLTLSCLADFGISIEHENHTRYIVRGHQRYKPCEYPVEGDYSQAAFFLVAGALGAPVECRGLRETSWQGDREILTLIHKAGAEIETTAAGGWLVKPPKTLRGQQVDVSNIPDLVPPLAVLLSLSEGDSLIHHAARLRYKESDRLAAVTRELNALGANIRETEDALHITGVPHLTGGTIQGWGDHRITMMAAVASIRCRNPVTVDDALSIQKSYPGFWKDFERIERNNLFQ